MSGLLSASPVDVQEAHEYNRVIQVCNTDFYWTLVTSSYCVSYRRLAIKATNDRKRCKFLGVFDPPCGNCLANLDGSVP